jgi:hypothetical protein
MNRATQLDDCDSLADFMQIMHGSALLGNVHDEVYGPVHARVLLPPVSARTSLPLPAVAAVWVLGDSCCLSALLQHLQARPW